MLQAFAPTRSYVQSCFEHIGAHSVKLSVGVTGNVARHTIVTQVFSLGLGRWPIMFNLFSHRFPTSPHSKTPLVGLGQFGTANGFAAGVQEVR